MPTNASPRRATDHFASKRAAQSCPHPTPPKRSAASPEDDLEAELHAACWLDRGILAGLAVVAVVGIGFIAYALQLVDRSWGIMFELVRYALS